MTQKETPAYSFTPIYNPLEFVYDSANNSADGFSYVFDVYISGAGSYNHRFLVDPHPTLGYGRIDLRSVLESEVTSNIDISQDSVDSCGNSIVDFVLKVGERSDASGTVTDISTSSTYYPWNASLYHDEFIDYSNQYLLSSGSTNKFLTNSPRTIDKALGDYSWLYGLSEDVTKVKIITYDSAGSTNGEFDLAYSGSAYATTADRMFSIPTGKQLESTLPTGVTVVSGAQPILDSDVASYTVQAYAGTTASSELFTYNVVNRCVRTTPKEVVFLNSLGGFDSFVFELASIPTRDKEVRQYKQDFGTLNADGTIGYSKSQHLKKNYYTTSTQKLRVSSNYLTEAESEWLKELFDSPEVYLVEGDELIAIQGIEETNYEEKQKEREKLFRLEFTLVYSWDNYRQRW